MIYKVLSESASVVDDNSSAPALQKQPGAWIELREEKGTCYFIVIEKGIFIINVLC